MDHKEPDSARNIQTAHEDQEGHPVGRRVMDEWVLCKHRRLVCEERDHQKGYIENQGRQEEYTQLYSSQIELDFNP